MYYFCTYFDQNYLSRGLALYESLVAHCADFKLFVLCMDETTSAILYELDLPQIQPLPLEEFERHDKRLQDAKTNRTRIEYYFTCSPSLPWYILNNWPEVDLITYLDADLFFFASPAPLFDELGAGSIAIIGHRFPPHLKYKENFGIYNVGWLSFRRDANAITALEWWRQRCLEWCYDRPEEGRYADQKYLDSFPGLFQEVVVLEHKGANLAPWNLGNYSLHAPHGGLVRVDEQPLIFFHFHGLKKIGRWLYDPGWLEYGIKPSRVLSRGIYLPYLQTLARVNHWLLSMVNDDIVQNGIRFGGGKQGNKAWQLLSMIGEMLRGRYIFLFDKYIIAFKGLI